jgi:signal transduction histidine kinase
VETSLDLRGLLHAILTCVTAGPGLGFNRAALFLADDDETRLCAAMAIGPATPEEARATWARLASEDKSLDELLLKGPGEEGKSGFQALVEGLVIPLAEAAPSGALASDTDKGSPANASADANPLLDAYRNRRILTITDPASLRGLPPRLREVFNGTEVVCVPLMAKERSVGLIVADNAFTGQPIGRERIQLLQLLALLAGLALDNARIYRQIERQAKQLSETLDQLKAAQEQLIHSERLATVGAVVARVSHEIRNPLTTIGGFARTLGAHPDETDRVARNANIIVDEVEKLEALLKEMLDFTSPRPPALERTDLNGLLATLANVHRDELAERKVAMALELAPGLPLVLADRNQLHRVFLNLWQNAVQAMEESPVGQRNKLIVQSWPDGDTIKIAFSDTGIGIPRDVIANIFTPFFTTKQRGTGLGLAVAKKIIDDHRGSIHVRSERGAGTTIVVVLPVAR